MKAKFLGIPVVMVAAVVAIWWFFVRGRVEAQSNQPSAAASGVPNYTPQAQEYNINPPTMAPYTPTLQIFGDPTHQTGGFWAGTAPNYLRFNLFPSHDLSKDRRQFQPPAASEKGCGCSESPCSNGVCANNNAQFTDGQGNGCMSVSERRLIKTMEAKKPEVFRQLANELALAYSNEGKVAGAFVGDNFALRTGHLDYINMIAEN
jgi:hypothetical protein